MYRTKKTSKWISITFWKIKHKQNNFKNLILKNNMQNSWSEIWDWDKFIEKNKDNYKINSKKKCKAIKLYEAGSLKNQMSKDEVKKKINYIKEFKK